jgi:ribonuclease Z
MHGRYPTAQAVKIKNNWFLIDCGEGAQMRFLQYHVKVFRVDQIFISHLHGDHYFGLIGLLTSYHLLKRSAPLTIFAPAQLKDIIALQLAASHTILNYELNFVDTQADHLRKIYENGSVEVFSFPLIHKIPTTGFLFREKHGERQLNASALQDIELEKKYYKLLKQGVDVEDQVGNTVKSEDVTFPPRPTRSYAFCSDTMYDESYLEVIKEVDLLYHEATFLQADRDRALDTWHTTALEAAQMAKAANAKKLLIGHFSSRYTDLNLLLAEARTVFENTELAIEGEVFRV